LEEDGGKWKSSEVEMDNDDNSDDIDYKTNTMIVIRTIRKMAINNGKEGLTVSDMKS
jgi:hypothetical protein